MTVKARTQALRMLRGNMMSMFDEQDDIAISWDFIDPEEMFIYLIPFLNNQFKPENNDGIMMENRILQGQISNQLELLNGLAESMRDELEIH